MKQNIYDDPVFFAGYSTMRAANAGLNDVLERPAMRSLLPPVAGLSVLDLGCGMGQLCRELAQQGAAEILGIDISEKMLAVAAAEPVAHLCYLRCAIEDFTADEASFDLIVSSLTLHYVQDFAHVCTGVARWLRPGGTFVLSVEHPIATAAQGKHPGWIRDVQGAKQYWAVDHYHDEGVRQSRWFIDGVVKYHRTTATLLNMLIEQGLMLERVLEPHATEDAESQDARLIEERRRPPFLIIRASRPH